MLQCVRNIQPLVKFTRYLLNPTAIYCQGIRSHVIKDIGAKFILDGPSISSAPQAPKNRTINSQRYVL